MECALPVRRIRAVLFDAGNTLLHMDYAAIAARLSIGGPAVAAGDDEEAELRARVLLDRDLAAGASTESRDTHGRYLRYVLGHLGIAGDERVEEIARWRAAYNPPFGLWMRASEAEAALRRVKSAGLMAGVISNSNGSVRAILEAIGLARHLDVIVDSAVVGVEKPDPRIFEIALREAGVAAPAACYVGDLYSVDVLGARRAGLDAVLLDPRGYWGSRDCLTARSLDDAVSLCLG